MISCVLTFVPFIGSRLFFWKFENTRPKIKNYFSSATPDQMIFFTIMMIFFHTIILKFSIKNFIFNDGTESICILRWSWRYSTMYNFYSRGDHLILMIPLNYTKHLCVPEVISKGISKDNCKDFLIPLPIHLVSNPKCSLSTTCMCVTPNPINN